MPGCIAFFKQFKTQFSGQLSLFSSQELSKITMPVIFNEPLSFLQRLTEYMEHTYLIHQANAATDSLERMKVPGVPDEMMFLTNYPDHGLT